MCSKCVYLYDMTHVAAVSCDAASSSSTDDQLVLAPIIMSCAIIVSPTSTCEAALCL